MRPQTSPRRILAAVAGLAAVSGCQACGSCFGPVNKADHVRHAKRMQPDAHNATYGPTRGPLEWGQLNFLHTTDTHGWLEGHLTETNYGADWGDFVSFAARMRARADELGVDLLLVDTGDLHDGAGLSDATPVDGALSNVVFERLGYDLLTIGNHELYYADIAYQDYDSFSKAWGDRYLTSNVQILNATTGQYQPLGSRYKYLTTPHGLRILALGVIFDFTGNTNVTRVVPASEMVAQPWFTSLLASPPGPVDLFLLLGHNTAAPQPPTGTFGYVHDAIRAAYPSTPVQMFGGHSHIRDFRVYDGAATALESGRYCETLGWLSMAGFGPANTASFTGVAAPGPAGVPNPSRSATTNSTSSAPWTYSRRYLDWNRLTFEYHASGSQTGGGSSTTAAAFDTPLGLNTTRLITDIRHELNLTAYIGCSPQLWCQSCAEFNSPGSIYSLLSEAMSAVVVNPDRADRARVSIINTGSVRFDLHRGPFLHDDAFIVSPFDDIFVYIPDVPYSVASGALDYINKNGNVWKRSSQGSAPLVTQDTCADPFLGGGAQHDHDHDHDHQRLVRHTQRRQSTTTTTTITETQGYTTTDAFGTDGDDTAHAPTPQYPYPHFFQALGGFPADNNGSSPATPDVVDLIFIDFIQPDLLDYLGPAYSAANVSYYIDESFSTRTYLPLYVQQSEAFRKDPADCSIY